MPVAFALRHNSRSQRIVNKRDEHGVMKKQREGWSKIKGLADANAFQDDAKKILIFSAAGGTGMDYHADLSRTNQMQRQIETRGLTDENYLRFAYGAMGACVIFENNESPREGTLDAGRIIAGRPNDAPAARTSAEIGAEIVNKNGVKISRAIVFGAEQIVESYVDENMYMTEAGLLGRVEARAAQNMGVEIYADGIRFIDRAPTDIFNEIATMAWSWTGDFVAPTNRLSSANGSSYPRAVVIEYAQTAF